MIISGTPAPAGSERIIGAIQASPLWSTPGLITESDQVACDIQGLDIGWYIRMNGSQMVSYSPTECVSHYRRNVLRAFVSPNLSFNEFWYRKYYLTVDQMVNAGEYSSGWDHYLRAGFCSGHNPASWFDESWYRKSQPAVMDAIARGELSCGFEHYLLHGIREGLAPSIYFNPEWYRQQYLSLNAVGPRRFPVVHFLLSGDKLKRCPVPFFDELWYHEQYLKTTGINELPGTTAFEHYLVFGRRLIYSPSPHFNERVYREAHPWIEKKIAAGEIASGFEHYVTSGVLSGIVPPNHFGTAGIDSGGPAFLREYEKSLRLNLKLYLWLRGLVESGPRG